MGIINSLRFKGAELSSLARQMQRGLDKEGRSKHQKGLPIKSTKAVYVKERSGMRADLNEKQLGKTRRGDG